MKFFDIFKIRASGSFTVEAAFLYPIIIFIIAFMLCLSIDWYESVDQASQDIEAVQELDMRTYFLQKDEFEDILSGIINGL